MLILAGGSGERLWPVSDAAKPKQFMKLADGETFLQSAISRAVALDIEGDIIIVTRRDWTELVIADVVSLAKETGNSGLLSKVLVMSEPCGKNTAPAIVWTAKYLLGLKRARPVNILLMASDHIIKSIDSFVSDVETRVLVFRTEKPCVVRNSAGSSFDRIRLYSHRKAGFMPS